MKLRKLKKNIIITVLTRHLDSQNQLGTLNSARPCHTGTLVELSMSNSLTAVQQVNFVFPRHVDEL